MMPTNWELERGVGASIVHDYGTLVLTGEAIPTGIIPHPWIMAQPNSYFHH